MKRKTLPNTKEFIPYILGFARETEDTPLDTIKRLDQYTWNFSVLNSNLQELDRIASSDIQTIHSSSRDESPASSASTKLLQTSITNKHYMLAILLCYKTSQPKKVKRVI